MRSTTELITELRKEAGKHFTVGMVVGFENTTVFILPKDDQGLQTLKDAVRTGGTPMGLIAADAHEGEITVSVLVYPEYAQEKEVHEYMEHLSGEFARLIVAGAGGNHAINPE